MAPTGATMITIEQILEVLADLNKEEFEVHVIDNAWYSVRAMTEALTSKPELVEAYPRVKAVRVALEVSSGMLELHPRDNGVEILCYCCFGGDFQKGIVTLDR